MDIIINGVTLQGNFMDADFVGPYEVATKKMQETAAASRGKQYASLAEGYLDQCKTVDEYFDDIFGPGTAAKVFQGSEHDLMVHLMAVEDLTSWAQGEKKKLNDFTNKYTQRQNAQIKQQQQRQQMQQFVSTKGGKGKGGKH